MDRPEEWNRALTPQREVCSLTRYDPLPLVKETLPRLHLDADHSAGDVRPIHEVHECVAPDVILGLDALHNDVGRLEDGFKPPIASLSACPSGARLLTRTTAIEAACLMFHL